MLKLKFMMSHFIDVTDEASTQTEQKNINIEDSDKESMAKKLINEYMQLVTGGSFTNC